MSRSIRTIVYVVLGAGILAFFGSFLIPAIIKAAPSSGKDAIRDMITDDRGIVVAFLGFLGAIIGLLKSFDTQGPTCDDEEREEDPSKPAPAIRKDDPRDQIITILKQRLSNASETASQRIQLARKIGKSAVKYYSYHTVLWVALIFSLCTFASGTLQGLLQKAFPTKPDTGWSHYALAFFQTEALLLCACGVPLWYYSRFLRRTNHAPPALGRDNATRIGGLSLFLAGIISLTHLSPEQISMVLMNSSLVSLPLLTMNYMVYLVLCRLLLFPAVGVCACHMYRRWACSTVAA